MRIATEVNHLNATSHPLRLGASVTTHCPAEPGQPACSYRVPTEMSPLLLSVYYQRLFYVPLLLLHTSVLRRIVGNTAGKTMRSAAEALNAAALIPCIIATIGVVPSSASGVAAHVRTPTDRRAGWRCWPCQARSLAIIIRKALVVSYRSPPYQSIARS